MRMLIVITLAALVAGCAGAYVAVDGGPHTATVRTGQSDQR
jgi:hypothetical protein